MSLFCKVLGLREAYRERESFRRMINSYSDLQELDPANELLNLAKSDSYKSKPTYDELIDRFHLNNRRGKVGVYLMYKIKLDKAAREFKQSEQREKEAREYSSKLLGALREVPDIS